MIITAPIDLSPDTYRFFLRQAEEHEGKTPEEMIALFLENYVRKETQIEI